LIFEDTDPHLPLAEMFEASILEFWDLSEDKPWLFVPGTQGRYDWCFTQAFKHHFTADGSQKEEEEHVCASGLCMCGFACLPPDYFRTAQCNA